MMEAVRTSETRLHGAISQKVTIFMCSSVFNLRSVLKVRDGISQPYKTCVRVRLSSGIRFWLLPPPHCKADYFSCRKLRTRRTVKSTFPWQLVIFVAHVKIRTALCRLQNFISYSELYALAVSIFWWQKARQLAGLLILQVQEVNETAEVVIFQEQGRNVLYLVSCFSSNGVNIAGQK
jgi:hypothetical protein